MEEKVVLEAGVGGSRSPRRDRGRTTPERVWVGPLGKDV